MTRRIPRAGIEILQAAGLEVDIYDRDDAPLPAEALRARASGVDGVLSLLDDRIDAAFMDAVPTLRGVSNFAVGHDNIDVAEARRRGIVVTNTPDVLTEATADFAFALLLGVARRVVEGDRMMREGRFTGWGPSLLLGHAVAGRTLGIVGLGRIGRAVAERARGFRMRVLCPEGHGTLGASPQDLVEKVPFDHLLASADFISLHAPLNPQTRHLIGTRELALMKPTAYLINTARGPLVDEDALAAALQAGRLAGAALDVHEDEPQAHPVLAALDNCLLAPHIASATIEARTAMATVAATNLAAVMRGERPPNPVAG